MGESFWKTFFYRKGREGFAKDHKARALAFLFSGRIPWTIRYASGNPTDN